MMATQRNYSNAPITEALIDIQVRSSPALTVAQLAEWKPVGAYPGRTKLHLATGEFELGERVATSAAAEHVGYRLASADEKQIIQVRLNGFTFSRLAPYASWEPFRDEARRQWSSFRERFRSLHYERLP